MNVCELNEGAGKAIKGKFLKIFSTSTSERGAFFSVRTPTRRRRAKIFFMS